MLRLGALGVRIAARSTRHIARSCDLAPGHADLSHPEELVGILRVPPTTRGSPAGQRDAVVLFHLAGLPQATVAARLNTATGAVRTRWAGR